MSSITINLGDAFLLDTPPNGQHLYIAIAQTSEWPKFRKETRFLNHLQKDQKPGFCETC